MRRLCCPECSPACSRCRACRHAHASDTSLVSTYMTWRGNAGRPACITNRPDARAQCVLRAPQYVSGLDAALGTLLPQQSSARCLLHHTKPCARVRTSAGQPADAALARPGLFVHARKATASDASCWCEREAALTIWIVLAPLVQRCVERCFSTATMRKASRCAMAASEGPLARSDRCVLRPERSGRWDLSHQGKLPRSTWIGTRADAHASGLLIGMLPTSCCPFSRHGRPLARKLSRYVISNPYNSAPDAVQAQRAPAQDCASTASLAFRPAHEHLGYSRMRYNMPLAAHLARPLQGVATHWP